jgi:prolipoprotein diacylglyceryl transferase
MHPRLLTLPVPEFNLLGLHFGPTITLHTYGLLLAIAFIAGLWVASREAKRQGLDAGRVTDMAIWVLIAGLIGAKVLLVLVDFRYYQRSPRELWSIFQSGGVFYGGLIGGALVAWWYARRHGLAGWSTADALAPGVVLGQAIGRLGCFAAGCCWGKPTSLPRRHFTLYRLARSARRWTRRRIRAASYESAAASDLRVPAVAAPRSAL